MLPILSLQSPQKSVSPDPSALSEAVDQGLKSLKDDKFYFLFLQTLSYSISVSDLLNNALGKMCSLVQEVILKIQKSLCF